MEAVARLSAMIAGQGLEKNEVDIMAVEPDSERELISRIATGEAAALRALYEMHGARLYSLALRISGNPAAADDILQDSLLAIWRGAAKFRGEGRVIAWLLGIVHHKAMDAVRGRRTSSLDEEDGDLPSSAPSPDERIISHERSNLIKAGLGRLSMNHRLVLDLVFFQGLSLAETAEVCGCPVGTVKSRLNHAKAGLRAILATNDHGEKSR